MSYLTYEQFKIIEEKNKYFNGRWEYFSNVIEMAKSLDPKKTLEIGAVGCKLINESKVLDIRNEYKGVKYNVDYLLDITKDLDKIKEHFDLIICLQVFEHLGGSQQKVFKGLMERTNNLIISVPYLWENEKDLTHYNITIEKIKNWTCFKKPKEVKIIGDNNKRVIIRF